MSCRTGAIAFYSRSRADYTFCQRFFDMADPNNQARNLLHESAHGTSGLSTRDWSYRWERMIELLGTLEPAQALNNSDSYTILVMLINGIGAVGGFPPASDIYDVGMTTGPGGQRERALRAMAYLQTWLTAARSDVSYLYRTINDRVGVPWPASGASREIMNRTHGLFGLTTPPASPARNDQWKTAAIYDRYHTMREHLKQPHEVGISTTGSTRWVSSGGEPTTRVELHPSFFNRPILRRIRLLLLRLVSVIPHVSRGLRMAYVNLADRLRRRRRVGP